jgi:hypothetical protein
MKHYAKSLILFLEISHPYNYGQDYLIQDSHDNSKYEHFKK